MKNNQISYKFSDKFWKKIQESFHIYSLLENIPKKAEKLYELDPEDINVDLKEITKW